jgi:hypothetical protein
MKTKVNITKDYYQIRIPVSEVYSNKAIRRFLDFLKIREIASQSKATEKQISELADEVTESFWKKNKDSLLNETRNRC